MRAADEHADTVTSLIRSRAVSSTPARFSAVTRSGSPVLVSEGELAGGAVAGDVDDVPSRVLLEDVQQAFARDAVLQDPDLYRPAAGGDTTEQPDERVPLAAEAEGAFAMSVPSM